MAISSSPRPAPCCWSWPPWWAAPARSPVSAGARLAAQSMLVTSALVPMAHLVYCQPDVRFEGRVHVLFEGSACVVM